MGLYLNVELCVIGKKRLYRLSLYVLRVAPVPVGADHLSELSSVISQMVDSEHVVAHGVKNFIQGISYYGASDVAYVERLCDVRRRKLHYDLLSLAFVTLSEVVAL